MQLLADISSGNTATADVMFLIAVVLAGLAAIAAVLGHTSPPRPDAARWSPALLCAAVALASLGWLVL